MFPLPPYHYPLFALTDLVLTDLQCRISSLVVFFGCVVLFSNNWIRHPIFRVLWLLLTWKPPRPPGRALVPWRLEPVVRSRAHTLTHSLAYPYVIAELIDWVSSIVWHLKKSGVSLEKRVVDPVLNTHTYTHVQCRHDKDLHVCMQQSHGKGYHNVVSLKYISTCTHTFSSFSLLWRFVI
jgi:hypothetical protein